MCVYFLGRIGFSVMMYSMKRMIFFSFDFFFLVAVLMLWIAYEIGLLCICVMCMFFLLLNNVPNIVVFFPGFICRQNVWIFSLLGRWAHPAALLWYYPQSSNAFKWYFMDSLPHSEMCVCVWFFCVITWQMNQHALTFMYLHHFSFYGNKLIFICFILYFVAVFILSANSFVSYSFNCFKWIKFVRWKISRKEKEQQLGNFFQKYIGIIIILKGLT